MLDTNIFNRLLDNEVDITIFPVGSSLFATKVQYEELNSTRNLMRRTELIQKFKEIEPDIVPASFSLDIAGAGLDEGTLSEGDYAQKLWIALEVIQSKSNNWHDALIAEAAYINGCRLVTADRNLSEVAKEHGLTVWLV